MIMNIYSQRYSGQWKLSWTQFSQEILLQTMVDFPGSSADKESACNAGDPNSIPGSGRSPGEGKGYSLQNLLASLVAQMVKWLPAMRETRVRFLGQEDPLEKEMAIHSSILAWKILWTEEPGKLQSMGL